MVYTRLTRLPGRSFFLFGVRGVGTSSWSRTTLPDALRLDLLDEALFLDLLADPSLFRKLVSAVSEIFSGREMGQGRKREAPETPM